MIVKKPIGAIKVNGLVNRLSVGRPVPKIVLNYWKETKQLKKLLESGIIEDEKKVEKVKNDTVRSDTGGQSKNSE
jgi:hypothetical protein